MIGPLSLLAAYLIGGVPFGYLLVRLKTGRDVRKEGSGNIGATNVLRTQGKFLGILTLVLDTFKGWFAVWLAGTLTAQNGMWMSFAGLAVLLGHAFPLLLKFQGGKAVASAMGAFLYLAPLPLAAVVVVFVAVVASSGYISLGSIVAAAALPFGIWMILHPEWHLLLVSMLAAALVIGKHHSNIARLRAGTENVFRWKKG